MAGLRRPPAKPELTGNTPVGIPSGADRGVVAAVDRPIVRLPEHESEARAVPNVRGQKTTPTRQALKRLLEYREVKDRHLAQPEHAPINGRRLPGRDLRARRPQRPPGMVNVAVGHKAIVNRIVISRLVDNFSLDIERIVRRQQARAALTRRTDRPMNVVERPQLGPRVVVELLGVQILLPQAVAVAHIAARLHLISRIVVIDLIRRNHRVVKANLDSPPQETLIPHALLTVSNDFEVTRTTGRNRRWFLRDERALLGDKWSRNQAPRDREQPAHTRPTQARPNHCRRKAQPRAQLSSIGGNRSRSQ